MDRNGKIIVGTAGIGAVIYWLWKRRQSAQVSESEPVETSPSLGNVSISMPGIDWSVFGSGNSGDYSTPPDYSDNIDALTGAFIDAIKKPISSGGAMDLFPLFGYAAGGDTTYHVTNNVTQQIASNSTPSRQTTVYQPPPPAPTLVMSNRAPERISAADAERLAKSKASAAAQSAQKDYFSSSIRSGSNPYHDVYEREYRRALAGYGY